MERALVEFRGWQLKRVVEFHSHVAGTWLKKMVSRKPMGMDCGSTKTINPPFGESGISACSLGIVSLSCLGEGAPETDPSKKWWV